MKSAKTANLIIKKDSLNKRNVNTICIKPAIDTRSSSGKFRSRIGIECDVDYIVDEASANENLATQIFIEAVGKNAKIFIDEVQFLNTIFLKTLIHKVQDYSGYADNIELFMYGLLKTYKGKLFPTSLFLVENVDNLIEIKTFCDYKNCGEKAIYTYLEGFNNNEDIKIGDKEYSVYCPKHFHELME